MISMDSNESSPENHQEVKEIEKDIYCERSEDPTVQHKTPSPWDLLYWVIFQPTKGMNQVAAFKPVAMGFTVYFFVQLFSAIINWRFFVDQLAGNFDLPFSVSQAVGIPILIFGIFLGLIFLMVYAAVTNFIAELLGGQGNGVTLLTTLLFAGLPGLFGGMASIIAVFLDIGLMEGVLLFLVFIWRLYLQVLAVRESHKISNLKAFLVIITPYIVLVGVVLGLLLVMFGTLAPMLTM